MKINPKKNKCYLIKLTSFCMAKETTHKMKRQLTGWEKIFADDQGINLQNIQTAHTA